MGSSTMSLLQTLGRDLRAITSGLLGGRPAPFSKRTALQRHGHFIASGAELLAPRPARIASITRETADAVSLEISTDVPLAFAPGQFLTVVITIDGEVHRRAYSISSAPHDGRVTVTVKRMGLVSGYLVERAREGERIDILGPSGSFVLTPDPTRTRKLVLIGGGSGITPLFSIARAVLHVEPRSRITLLYGNRSHADAIFREALDELARRLPGGRLSVRHVLGGQLDCDRELGAIDLDDADVFICGPAPMMIAARTAVLSRGVDPSRVHEEKFTSPTQRRVTLPTAPQSINLKLDGGTRTVIAAPGQTLLEAGLSAGAPMPYSCTMGGCGACKAKLVDGEVESEEPNCLTAQEREQGYVLTCITRAASTTTIEVA
jgi:ring-1,2-phenylacetyl-CoA epoxidase subunit PaaE